VQSVGCAALLRHRLLPEQRPKIGQRLGGAKSSRDMKTPPCQHICPSLASYSCRRSLVFARALVSDLCSWLAIDVSGTQRRQIPRHDGLGPRSLLPCAALVRCAAPITHASPSLTKYILIRNALRKSLKGLRHLARGAR
jgi:hypothetical protein